MPFEEFEGGGNLWWHCPELPCSSADKRSHLGILCHFNTACEFGLTIFLMFQRDTTVNKQTRKTALKPKAGRGIFSCEYTLV